MEAPLNSVIAGLYEGQKIVVDSNSKYAYIEPSVFISKSRVSSIGGAQAFTGSSFNSAATGAVIAGAAGAVVGATNKATGQIVTINWNDGNKSLVKISNDVYEACLRGMYTSLSLDEEQKIVNNDRAVAKATAEKAEMSKALWALAWAGFCILAFIMEN